MARETDVSPEILRFTQDSIKNTFKEPYEYQRIDDAVDQIGNNQLSPAVLMPLNVVQHRSVLWSLDNRRLWVLRKAGVPTVKVMLVLPNHNTRSREFFSPLNDPLFRQYSSADYFPRVRGGVRSRVGINRRERIGDDPLTRTPHYPTAVAGASNTTAMTPAPPTATVRGDCRFVGISPPPPIEPSQLDHPARVNAGPAQANYRPPNSPPPQRPLRSDITVRSNIPQISPLPDNYHQKRNTFVSNSNSCPGGKKGSDTLWGKILNAVNCAMEKGLGILRFLRSWYFDPCNEKVLRVGMNSLVVLCLCLALRQSYKLGQGSVNSKLYSRETITASEGRENVLRAENGSGFFENLVNVSYSSVNVFGAENGGSSKNVLSDQNNNNNEGATGYFSIVAFKAVVGVEKMISHLLSKTYSFLRSVVRNCVDLSKGVLAGSGRKALGTCSVVLSECFSSLHFITGQAAVSFGRMGIRVSEFCLEKVWEMLRFIKSQPFGVPSQLFSWSVGKLQDVLSFYMNEIKEFLRKVVCLPQMALSLCLNKVKELAQGVISFCLNKIKELLGLQGF